MFSLTTYIIGFYFLQDENMVNRPVNSFVKPLRGGRLLDSARHAARFVSLIHHEKVQSLGGGSKTEQWTNSHAFLCRNKGVSCLAFIQNRIYRYVEERNLMH